MKICIIVADLHKQNSHLQPQCYIYAACRSLIEAGEDVQVISDGYPLLPEQDNVGSVPIRRINNVRCLPFKGNDLLIKTLKSYQPDIVLWSVGLSSLLHLRLGNKLGVPVIGLFSSTAYHISEILKVGVGELLKHLPSFLPHIIGSLLPRPCPNWLLDSHQFSKIVAMTELSAQRLRSLGITDNRLSVVPPGVNNIFLNGNNTTIADIQNLRTQNGIKRGDFLVLYAGSPEFYRGLTDVIRAIPLVVDDIPEIQLLVLSRPTGSRSVTAHRDAQLLTESLGIIDKVNFINKLLSPEQIRNFMCAADTVTLPFRLVASGVPIALLEALATGTPVVTTSIAGMDEFINKDYDYAVPPHSPKAIAGAISGIVKSSLHANGDRVINPRIHSWEQTGKEIHRVIRSVIGER